MDRKKTARGFVLYQFRDLYGSPCSLQKSSLAETDAIWLGIDDVAPKVLASHATSYGIETSETTGWIPFPIPEGVEFTNRMHLTREQVEALLPMLQCFVDTGEI